MPRNVLILGPILIGALLAVGMSASAASDEKLQNSSQATSTNPYDCVHNLERCPLAHYDPPLIGMTATATQSHSAAPAAQTGVQRSSTNAENAADWSATSPQAATGYAANPDKPPAYLPEPEPDTSQESDTEPYEPEASADVMLR